jgi:hypothetical protein
MVREKSPGITGRPSCFQKVSQALEEIFSIRVASENISALHAPNNDMV